MASAAASASARQAVKLDEVKVVATSTRAAIVTFRTALASGESGTAWDESATKASDLSAFIVEVREANTLDFTTPWVSASLLSQTAAPRELATQLWQEDQIPSPIVRGAMIAAPGLAIPTSRQVREGSFCVVLTDLRPNCSYLARLRPLSGHEHEALKAGVAEVIHLAGGAYELLKPKDTTPSVVAVEKKVDLASPFSASLSLTTQATDEAAAAALEAVASAQLADEASTVGTSRRRRRLASTNATSHLLGVAQRAAAASVGRDMVIVTEITAKEASSDAVVVSVTLAAASDAAAKTSGKALEPILGGFAVDWSEDTWTARALGLFSREWKPAEADDDAGAIVPATASTSGKVPGKFRVMTSKRRGRQFDISVEGLPAGTPVVLRVWPLSEEEASSPGSVPTPAWPAPPTVCATTAAPPAPKA